MPLPIYRLRRLLAATAILLTVLVVGMYFYARTRARNVLKEIPSKIGIDIQKTANGFQLSKSDGKRTLFTVQASDVKEFKLNGRAELHNVNIILYGRDSSRYDRIYGDNFAYDPKTGDVAAKGEVQIDLVDNPAGLSSPDQSAPQDLRNPIHLKTRDLVFNKNSGNAATTARVDFSTAQATGWAVGVNYAGKSNVLTLLSKIHVELTSTNATIEAEHGVITNDPREVVLDRPHLDRETGMMQADHVVFHLNRDNNVEDALATGNVTTQTRTSSKTPSTSESEPTEIRSHADAAEFHLTGKQSLLRNTILSGNVHVEQSGPQAIEGDAGRVVLEFAGQNQLQKIHAVDNARLTQKASKPNQAPMPAPATSATQDFELTAPVIDFTVSEGHVLERAETEGAAQITITPSQNAALTAPPDSHAQQTIVTAGKFEAKFVAKPIAQKDSARIANYLSTIHGAPDARIVNFIPGQPDRVSTSDSVDAIFLAQGGLDAVIQTGNFAYTDGQAAEKRMQAWGNNARYTPADQMLVLTGAPRVTSGATATTAKTIRINRATGEALAEGDVKSTYSDVKELPDGALLASSSPIHVAAHSMTAHSNAGTALYTGNARLWQDANVIEAPSIQFDRDHRFVTAQGTPAAPVLTTLVQASRPATGKSMPSARMSPIVITASRMTYADAERRIHYERGVVARGEDFTASAKALDAFLVPHNQAASAQPSAGLGQLDHMIAQDSVVIQQPNRRAQGEKLVYTTADDKFVLTGGPPSIFDAEHGKITGVSLTFFRGDDRVLVEGEGSTPVVTQTRVAP